MALMHHNTNRTVILTSGTVVKFSIHKHITCMDTD